MAIVTYTLDVDAFGTAQFQEIPDFIRTLTNVQTTASSNVTVTVDFLGDFYNGNNGYGQEFELHFEGFVSGSISGGNQYEAHQTSFTIDKATWQNIISDGSVQVYYNMGNLALDWSGVYNVEEYINITFTWDDGVTVSRPDPTKFTGTSGNDFLPGTDGSDLINAGAGNDSVFAGNGDDVVNGGAGDDVIGGGTGNDKLSGDAGNDMLFGGNGNDQIFGGEGNDVAWGGKGADVIKGDAGDDLLGGGLGRDALYGGDGADTLFGGADNDRLYGDAGNDTLYGGAGDDALTDGKGDDFLSGGTGADTFIFSRNEGEDVIRDFNGKDGDQIDLGNQTYEIVENEQGSAVIELSGGGSITLNGIDVDDVDTGWFLAA